MLASAIRAGEAVRIPWRRHRGMPAGRGDGGVRLPRDEHQAPSRAPGDRAGHRHRPGGTAVPDRRGRACVVRRGRAGGPGRARDRVAGLRRGPAPLPAESRPDHSLGRAGGARGSGWTPGTRRHHGDHVLRPAAGEAVRARHNRDEALARARAAVADFRVEGLKTNLPFHAELLDNPEFVSGEYDTGLASRMRRA